MDLHATLTQDLKNFEAEEQQIVSRLQQLRQAVSQHEHRLIQLAALKAHLGQRLQEAQPADAAPPAQDAGHGV